MTACRLSCTHPHPDSNASKHLSRYFREILSRANPVYFGLASNLPSAFCMSKLDTKHGKHFAHVTEPVKFLPYAQPMDLPNPNSSLSLPAKLAVKTTPTALHLDSHTHTHTSHTHNTPLTHSFECKRELFTYLLCAYGNEMANKRMKGEQKLR